METSGFTLSRWSRLRLMIAWLALTVTFPGPAVAQAVGAGEQSSLVMHLPAEPISPEVEAILALLSQYRSTQDAGDLLGQAELMTPDRVWINQAGIRRTDNAENTRVQQMEADSQRERLPGLKTVTMDRDVLISFHAGGKVAIVSFYRTAFRFHPPGTSKELREEYGPGSETGTLVLEKLNGEWKIVHTHWSGR